MLLSKPSAGSISRQHGGGTNHPHPSGMESHYAPTWCHRRLYRAASSCILERMTEPQNFRRGDSVVWWDDHHGRGLDPGHPDAVRLDGIIDTVCYSPADPDLIVAYLVARRGGVAGSYLVTVRPDHGHQLAHAEDLTD